LTATGVNTIIFFMSPGVKSNSWTRRDHLVLAGLLVSLASAVAGGLCLELGYRLWLFFDYGARIGRNHVADGYFANFYEAAVFGAVVAAPAFWMIRRTGWRRVIIAVTAANLVLGACMLTMQMTGLLCSYRDFIYVYHMAP